MNTEPMNPAEAVEAGVADAATVLDAAEKQRRQAVRVQVATWLHELQCAREFDKAIREGIARDRRYARGDTGFEVSVPLIPGAIDTLVSFLYARDPDVDCVPSAQVEAPKEPPPSPPQPPPGLEGLLSDPTQALQSVATQGLEGAAMQVGYDLARQQAEYQQAQSEYEARLMAYQAEQEERRQRRIERALFAQTLEIVISKLWRKGKLKKRARKVLRSCLTTGQGWLKLSWQERTVRDPVTQQRLNDLQESLERIARQMHDVEYCPEDLPDLEAAKLKIEQEMAGLQERMERVVYRGLAIDMVSPENLQVASGVDLTDYLDAPWICERIYMTIADAAARWPDVDIKDLRRATRYRRRQPKDCDDEAPEREYNASDADQYVEGDANEKPSDLDYIAIEEKWSLDDGLVYRTAQGLDFWLDEPAPPNVRSQRFYPYFLLAMYEVDGERAPQSLPQRTWRLANEYNRTRSAFAEMRRRSYPAVLFDATSISPDEADNLVRAQRQELIPIKTTSGKPLADCFSPKPVAGLDPMMYDTTPIIRDFDRTTGTQEALQGTVEAAKTATEAEIQQTGFQTRTASGRDTLEDWLGEIAVYTAEIAVQKLDPADVLMLAGGDAVWPQLDSVEELDTLMDISIRAGSSGKPDTRGQREQWQVVMPLLMQAIHQVAQLRGAAPGEVADKIEALVETTFERMGDRVDVSHYLPQHEGMAPGMVGGAPPSPAPGVPGAIPPPSAGDPAQPEVA